MDWPLVIVHWLHVFFGIFWFGGSLYVNFVMVPAILTLPSDRQMPVIDAITGRSDRILPWVGAVTIALGIVLGTIVGPIKDVAALSSTYGILWLVGLVAAVATWIWGEVMIGRVGRRLSEVSAQVSAGAVALSPDLARLADRLKFAALAEMVGFLVVFTAMVLMNVVGAP